MINREAAMTGKEVDALGVDTILEICAAREDRLKPKPKPESESK